MPQGCGTWPAIWETKEAGWPRGGEADILEGVNGSPPNIATLHTTAGCTMPANRSQTGTTQRTGCEGGCNVQFPTRNSYGKDFNANGGGWYVFERTNTYIKVWFFPANGGTVPSGILNPTFTIDTLSWPLPGAYFPNTSCDIPKYFAEHNIIINLTFCGGWGDSAYQWSGCPGTCIDFVNKNTDYFKEDYFNIAALRIYK